METSGIGEEFKLAEILQRPQNKSNQDNRREEQLKALSEILSELDDFQNIVNQSSVNSGFTTNNGAQQASISYINNSESTGLYQPQNSIQPNNIPGNSSALQQPYQSGQQSYPNGQQSGYPIGAQQGYAHQSAQPSSYGVPADTQQTMQAQQRAPMFQQQVAEPQMQPLQVQSQKVEFTEDDYKAIAEKVVERIKEEIPE